MNKTQKIVVVVLLILLLFISLFLFKVKNETNERKDIIKQSGVQIKNTDNLPLSDTEKRQCIAKLIKYLNEKAYYECSEIDFYKNTFDESSNYKYFYALVIGADKSLIEITNLENGNFRYDYIGNELTLDNQSSTTGVTYLQIVDPDKYIKEKKLEQIREEGKSAAPDDTEMP